MRILAIVHEARAGPGVFAEAIAERGEELDTWDMPAGSPAPADPRRYDAVLTFGGAMHPDQEEAHPWLASEKALLAELLAVGTPVLGVCLGAQLLAEGAGARTRPARRPEVGWYPVRVTEPGQSDPLLGPLAPAFTALEWHSYEFALPPHALPLAHSTGCLQAFRAGGSAWGIQFHAEVTPDDLTRWIDRERSPEELARLGFDRAELRASSAAALPAWNELGQRLCERFLDIAASTA